LREQRTGSLLKEGKFNEVAQQFNTYIKRFPANMIARWFDFNAKPYFESMEGAERAPEVKF
jgi:LemA protein